MGEGKSTLRVDLGWIASLGLLSIVAAWLYDPGPCRDRAEACADPLVYLIDSGGGYGSFYGTADCAAD